MSHEKRANRVETRRAYYQQVLAKKSGQQRNHTGTAAGPVRSMEEVAAVLHISRQAVHQIERRAMWKLRAALEPFWREHGAH